MKHFEPVEIEITYFTKAEDVITASDATKPMNDDEADVVKPWGDNW